MRWPRRKRGEPDHLVTGRIGERAAARFLKRRGYKIVAENLQEGRGEIDLVALEKRSRTLVFVEVRTRRLTGGEADAIGPEATVGSQKRRHIVQAAKRFLMRAGHRPDLPVRFDVVAVRFNGESNRRPNIRHFPGAFDAAGGLI